VFCYLFSFSIISFLQPFILSPQTYTIVATGSSSTQLAWPDAAINISALDWNLIASAALPLNQTKGVVTTGLSGGLLYDKLSPNPGLGAVAVNATLIDADCSLLPSSFWSNADGSPQLEDFISVIPCTSVNYLMSAATDHQYAGSDQILHIVSAEVDDLRTLLLYRLLLLTDLAELSHFSCYDGNG